MTVGRSGALAFFAGLGQGYMNQNELSRQQAIEDQRNKWQQTVQARQQAEWDRQDQQRAAVQRAAAPVTATMSGGRPDTMDNRDVGQPGEAPVAPVTFSVAGKTYGDQGQAQAATDAANTPQAQMGRIAAAIRPFDPAQAATLQSQATQSQLANLQLSKAQQDDVRSRFNASLGDLRTPQDVADLITKSKADGMGGAMRAATKANPDGSFTVNQVDADGNVIAPLGTFKSVDDAKNSLMKLSDEQKIVHLHQLAQEKIAQQNADTNEQYRRDQAKNTADKIAMMETIQEMKNEARAAGKGDPLAKMTDADKRQYSSATQEAQRLEGLLEKATLDGTIGEKPTPQQQALIDRARAARAQAAAIAFKYDKGTKGGGDLGDYTPTPAATPRGQGPGKAPATTPPIKGDTSGEFGAPDRTVSAPDPAVLDLVAANPALRAPVTVVPVAPPPPVRRPVMTMLSPEGMALMGRR